MVSARLPRPLTFDEYLLVEDASDSRNEFYRGAIYAMAGGTERHARIMGNVHLLLGNALKGTACRPYVADLRLFVEAAQLGTYPDLSVYCGPVLMAKGRKDVATNPTVLVEVLSPSTESFDRNEKFAAYKLVPSLKDCVLMAQDRPTVELFSRAGGDWIPSLVRGLENALHVPSLGVTLPLAEVFEGVEFGPG